MTKPRIIFAIVGAFIGFIIHYNITHIPTDVSLFSVGPHAIEGTFFTLIGVLVGLGFHDVLYKKNKGSLTKIIVTLALFAIAMALVEAAVVIYLRELYFPSGFFIQSAQDLQVIPAKMLRMEFWREAATIIMLICVAFLSFDRKKERFLAFVWTFSVWDLTFYLFLYIFLRWPESLTTLDVYFLIPWPLIGPVWFPLTLFSAGAIGSFWLLSHK